MTGTSLDAVDMAVLEADGETIGAFGQAGERKLCPATRAIIEEATRAALAWHSDAPRPDVFETAAVAIADEHLSAARDFMAEHGLTANDLDLIGVHGQTVLNEPPAPARAAGRTAQLIDAQHLADGLRLPVIHDFRTADVAAGGQGAPLVPIYHQALAHWSKLDLPIAVLNLGGVGNVNLVGANGLLEAFDTGPANGMIDLFVQARTGARCDEGGALAAAGRVEETVLAGYLAHPYFAARGPKSLDRFDFSLDPVADLSLEDGAATLTAFAAEAVALGVGACSLAPRQLVVCGGGRHNPVLMAAISERLPIPVQAAEAVGWRGDSIEAEAFAYLAARAANSLPTSFPTTTGVEKAISGGAIVKPS